MLGKRSPNEWKSTWAEVAGRFHSELKAGYADMEVGRKGREIRFKSYVLSVWIIRNRQSLRLEWNVSLVFLFLDCHLT